MSGAEGGIEEVDVRELDFEAGGTGPVVLEVDLLQAFRDDAAQLLVAGALLLGGEQARSVRGREADRPAGASAGRRPGLKITAAPQPPAPTRDIAAGPSCGTEGTIGTMSQPKAMNLRFPDPAQRAAIEAAARQEGVSLQEYILSAAYARATAVEERFLDAFRESVARSGDAFAEGAGPVDPGAQQRAADLKARRDLEEQQGQGRAA